MKQIRYTATQIVGMLREAEALLGTGKSAPEVCRHLEISESTYYRWRAEYTGMQVDQVTRLRAAAARHHQRCPRRPEKKDDASTPATARRAAASACPC